MTLTLTGEHGIRLEAAGPELDLSPDAIPFSPFHMLAAALAICTAQVLHTWARAAGLDADGLVLDVHWAMSDDRPRRVGRIEMQVLWPHLPDSRREAAGRAIAACPVHATLACSAEITHTIRTSPGAGERRG